MGRRDDQLKVRGVRIEPAEVERALLTLPGVQDVRVVLRGEADGQTLVAAVVAREDLDLADTRARAGKLLPAELVPDRFVRIESMPLSPNGKADRRALARLLDGPDAAERSAAERSAAERTAAPGSGGAGGGLAPGATRSGRSAPCGPSSWASPPVRGTASSRSAAPPSAPSGSYCACATCSACACRCGTSPRRRPSPPRSV
ncbi:hypothetical protein LUW77_13640 [Streptomyces radiopugnans]|nr:hypothetical protein LUW77_13640 [Streptomyces radiopugnans]